MCPYSGLSPLLSLLCKSLLNHGLERKHVHKVCIFMTKLLLEYKFCFRVALQLLCYYSFCHRCQRHWQQNYRQYQWHRRQICHRYQQHRRKFLPPVTLVLLIPVAFFATGVNDTGSKFTTRRQWHRWQIAWYQQHGWEQYQTADNLKWTWRKKLIYMLTLLPKSVQNKIIKTFLIEGFFHLPTVSTTPVGHLELRISPRISEKIWNGPMI